ncbi:hypothetical protein PIN31009_03571 [Pandoraea iniqua]|uniref:Uncharacterized protein n=1 Tax=Pandoraea iniqua TaxID=2508288 RepID=A0A5E4X0Y6_9BURK|nr:hypothetical protein [Pandoraea iniqua]VVE29981.1 hypothetical protein PIN31009_03571 [Pandoraea iniqua]VVE56347.1 hypothetical protein PIN31115_05058 [Pandoraea iniqua]
MTLKKFDLAKQQGLKINAGVRRGPPSGNGVGAQGKRNPTGSKLLGSLLGKAPAPADADAGKNEVGGEAGAAAPAKGTSKS